RGIMKRGASKKPSRVAPQPEPRRVHPCDRLAVGKRSRLRLPCDPVSLEAPPRTCVEKQGRDFGTVSRCAPLDRDDAIIDFSDAQRVLGSCGDEAHEEL